MKLVLKSAIAAVALVTVVACGGSKSKKDDAAAPQPTPAPSVAPAAGLTDDQGLALTGQFCMDCHSSATHKGGVVLDTLDGAKAAAAKSTDELNAGEMPPQGKPQPDADTKAKLTAWFTSKK